MAVMGYGRRWAVSTAAFILDRPHLKGHLYAGAEAMGLTGCERHDWVHDKLRLIDRGQVRRVISTFNLPW